MNSHVMGTPARESSVRVRRSITTAGNAAAMALQENHPCESETNEHHASGASGKSDRISRILRYIEGGAGNNTHLQHKRHVIVLGLTGSGKSTTINSLAGCKLRRVTKEEADRFELSRDALVVASGGKRGGRTAVTKIGNRFGKSQTQVLKAVAVDENNDDAVATFCLILIIMSKTTFLETMLTMFLASAEAWYAELTMILLAGGHDLVGRSWLRGLGWTRAKYCQCRQPPAASQGLIAHRHRLGSVSGARRALP
jgi:hypothetical protein